MSQQLAYVIITPYSLFKSRTGGILSRLITRTGLELAAVRMFAPSSELVKQYSEAIISQNDPQDRRIQQLIYDGLRRMPLRRFDSGGAAEPGGEIVIAKNA